MHLSHVIAACVLLGTTNAAKVLPMHKRFSYDPLVNDFSYLGMLSKRDACSDAFGSSAHNSNCAPDITLCCTRDGQSYPSCEKWLGKGWCCVGEGDNDSCYVDQESVCNEPGAVSCKRLKSGSSKACCPKLTQCDDNTDASEQYVRCNIDRGALIEAQSSSEAKTKTTSTAVSSSTEPPTTTTTSAPQTTAPESQTTRPSSSDGDDDSTLSGRAIGGIVVGAVGGIGLIAGLAWFFMRRKKNKDTATPPQPTIAQYYDDQTKYQQQGYWPQGSPNPPYTSSPQPPSELGNNQVPVEMDGGYCQYQQQQQQQSPVQPQSSPPPQQQSPFQQHHQQQ